MQTAIIEDTERRATKTVHIVSLNLAPAFIIVGRKHCIQNLKFKNTRSFIEVNLKIQTVTIHIIFVHTVVILILVTLQKEKNIKTLEGKIREQELQQLQEFAKKLSTDFVRNVCPRLQHQFLDLYKGKDGNKKLLRDVRFFFNCLQW